MDYVGCWRIDYVACWRIDYVACWRTGHGDHRPTEICHANHSRTRASVPCSPAPHLSIFKQKYTKIHHILLAGGWGTEATVLL